MSANNDIKVVIITGDGNKSFVISGYISYMLAMHSMEGRKFNLFVQPEVDLGVTPVNAYPVWLERE